MSIGFCKKVLFVFAVGKGLTLENFAPLISPTAPRSADSQGPDKSHSAPLYSARQIAQIKCDLLVYSYKDTSNLEFNLHLRLTSK
jgi:hypothetical protein